MDVVAAAEVARKKVGVADHIVTQTYPLVRDPKILLSALQNLADAIDAGIEAILLSGGRAVPATPEDRLEALGTQQRVPEGFIRYVRELRETLREHKESAVEFVRDSRFVICDDDYRLRTLGREQVLDYVRRAKVFVAMMEEKVNDASAA